MKPFYARLCLPSHVKALLWDMDGVLVDSLGLDITLVPALFSRALGRNVRVAPDYIRSLFALDPQRFIATIMDRLVEDHPLDNRASLEKAVLEEYEAARRSSAFPLHPGVKDMLALAREKGLRQAVVSNNPQEDLLSILAHTGIKDSFDIIIGNDLADEGKTLRKKPAPDFYLLAMKKLGMRGGECAVFEDSALGCQAGRSAGAHVIGLLTGSAGFEDLKALTLPPHQIYPDLVSAPLMGAS